MKNTDYDLIAPYYDLFNKGFDYKKYIDTVTEHLTQYTPLPFGSSAALDLGCGTGELMKYLVKIGFDCCGLDRSEDMLAQASSKEELSGCKFIHQDIGHIDLFRAYDIIFCCADVLNHLCYNNDLKDFFDRIYNFTEIGGYIVFDLKTEKEFLLNCKIEKYTIDGIDLSYSGEYTSPDMKTVLSVNDNGYKIKETINERFYSEGYISDILKESKFKLVEIFPFNGDERTIYIIKKEK